MLKKAHRRNIVMNVEKTGYKDWQEAYTLTINDMQMVVVTEVGPRVMSLSVGGGENILFNDDALEIQAGDWRIYGGHRFWISPETVVSYAPDNSACVVKQQDGVFSAMAPVAPDTLLQKRFEILEQDGKFLLRHVVRNTGTMLYQGGLWGLTCVNPTGKVFFPWGRPGNVWETKSIQYWPKWGGTHTSDVASSQWKQTSDLFVIEPTGEEGKVGTAGYEGFIGLSRPDCTFFKCFTHLEGANYPDNGCSVEAYTCSAFIELETLSPSYILYPEEEFSHAEHWFITSRTVDPYDGVAVRALCKK